MVSRVRLTDVVEHRIETTYWKRLLRLRQQHVRYQDARLKSSQFRTTLRLAAMASFLDAIHSEIFGMLSLEFTGDNGLPWNSGRATAVQIREAQFWSRPWFSRLEYAAETSGPFSVPQSSPFLCHR